MSLITERSYRDECVSPTIDVIQLIRIRRAKWLKLDSKSLVVQVLRRQSLHNRTKGDVFSDMSDLHFDALKDKFNSTMIRKGKSSLNLSNLTQLEISDLEYTCGESSHSSLKLFA